MDASSDVDGKERTVAVPAPSSPHDDLRAPIRALLDPLRELDVEGVELSVLLTRALELPAPLNVVIRGLFGARLRDLRCLTRAPTCDGCEVSARCDYIRIFETPAALTPGAHGSHGPHPFWLRGVPAEDHLPAGTELVARVSTIGFARPLLPYLDVALRDAWGRLGEDSVRLSASRTLRERVVTAPSTARIWTLRAVSPLILSGNTALAKEGCPAAPWLTLLVRAGVRRALSVGEAYAGGSERRMVAFPDLRGVEVVDGGFSPWRSSRYSMRQAQRHPLRGWMGCATVRGDVMTEVAPLLAALRVLGVGKGTTMGFGELWAEEATNDER